MLWFRYEKDLPDVVKGFSLTLKKGEFYAVLGGNGAGKTTSLKVISGLQNAYRGTIKLYGRVGGFRRIRRSCWSSVPCVRTYMKRFTV